MFFSDLDRTLIYSKRFKGSDEDHLIPVEEKEGRIISYMTHTAFQALENLRKQTVFVPVTARKMDEIMRIGFIRENMPEWMICEAGRSIYHKGKRYEPWDCEIDKIMKNHFVNAQDMVYKRFQTIMGRLGYPTWNINEYMLMTKVAGWTEDLKEIVEEEVDWFRKQGFSLLIQERKVYLFPNVITKANAIDYLINLLKPEKSVSSGDADMDFEMFDKTTYYMAPKHHTIQHSLQIVSKHEGVKAAEDIIQFASKQLCS